jgi:hypothetical protein
VNLVDKRLVTNMSLVNNRRVFFILIPVVITVVWAFTYVVGPLDSVPRLRASAKSPDGLITTRVYKQRLALYPILRVGILVRISDNQEVVLYERVIFEDSWWNEDIGEMYKYIAYEGDEIRIGPKYSPKEYFVIKRSELGSLASATQP